MEKRDGKLVYYCAIPQKVVVPEGFIPNSGYMPLQNEFLHFEKYDYRFHWNSSESIIEIWIPVQGKAFLDYISEEQ